MSATEIQFTDTESEKVQRWRVEALERAGYEPTAAAVLAVRTDIDLHTATDADRARLHARARAPHPALTRREASQPHRSRPPPDCRRRGGGHSAQSRGSCGSLIASIPSPEPRRVRRRPADDPHVRADAARRDPRVHLADRRPLAQASAATPTSSCASRSGASRPASSARASTTCSPRGARCPTRSGRASSRSGTAASASGAGSSSACSSGVLDRPPRRRVRDADDGRGRAGPAARAGHRPHRQLVQPGAVRQADRPAVGPRDRRRRTPPDYCASTTFHPTFLYELIWDLVGVGAADLGRPALADPPARAVRALRRLLHLRPLLRGAAARRPRARVRPAAAERVGLDRALHRLDRVLRLVAGARPRRRARAGRRRARSARCSWRGATGRRRPPKMAVPKGRVRGHG